LRIGRHRLKCGFHEQLGFGPWDQHRRTDEKLKRPKMLAADNVRYRLARFAALGEHVDRCDLFVGHRTARITDNVEARYAGARFQQ